MAALPQLQSKTLEGAFLELAFLLQSGEINMSNKGVAAANFINVTADTDNGLPSFLALCHFDWAVNAGCDRAIKTLQQVVGVKTDGIIGSVTGRAIANALSTHKESWLCDRYCAVREGCYRRWGVGSQSQFLKGWLNRLKALRTEISH